MTGLSFLSPYILLALLALPAIWFVLRAMPSAPKRFFFPGTFFLRDLKDKEQTPQRTPWWILLLRLLILACTIIALAEPVLNQPKTTDANGPLVMIVDDSWAAAPGWQLRKTALAAAAAEAEIAERPLFLLTTTPKRKGFEATALQGPLSADLFRQQAAALTPQAHATDRQQAEKLIPELAQALNRLDNSTADIRWLTDGITLQDGLETQRFAESLKDLGSLTIWQSPNIETLTLGPMVYNADTLEIPLYRTNDVTPPRQGTLSLIAKDGRLLSTIDYSLPAGATQTLIKIDLPLALRNEISLIRIDGITSTAAVQLADASNRRVMIGLVQDEDFDAGSLLDGHYYIRQALSPYGLFTTGTLSELTSSGADILILNDIGRLRPSDEKTLADWITQGGILIRFAGPALADATQGARDAEIALLPVPLRGGGRAFGGALTWEEPQTLGGFEANSPFANLVLDDAILIRRQVLARPGPEAAANGWAWLEDGTPLVTAKTDGKGMIVLFHVTATPDWSDLPISGTFVEMLRRIVILAPGGLSRAKPNTTYTPLRYLDGYGRTQSVPGNAQSITAREARLGTSPAFPPGLYGQPETPLALNAISATTQVTSLAGRGVFEGRTLRTYEGKAPQNLATPFFSIALILLLIDGLIALFLQNRLIPLRNTAGALTLAILLIPMTVEISYAQAPLAPKAIEAALETRLGYVLTGDTNLDDLSKVGLSALGTELYKRTALEPAPPDAVNLETDNLAVYPFLYWPVTHNTPVPSETALASLEQFMNGGGLLIIDTRDGERITSGQLSGEGTALRLILEQMNIPPLEPLPEGHVLRRSFYLLDDLPGRNDGGPIWVEARSALNNSNDGVTPIIIGGRDWAAAWARDEFGRSILPLGPGSRFIREQAYRSGINMAMVALTGNYKVDQLHATELLDRLGNE